MTPRTQVTGRRVVRPGVYRRHIRLRASAGVVHADMEDDSHRFGVTLRHDGLHVTAIEGRALRVPWSLCPGAIGVLCRLVGMPLAPAPLAASAFADQKQQCTHLFDLAAIAVSHAARDIAARDYRIDGPWYEIEVPRTITLYRDNEAVLEWVLRGNSIVGPEPYASIGVKSLLQWAVQQPVDPDALEALFVLRRAVLISGSRTLDLDRLATADQTGHGIGACYVHQPERITLARRNVGSSRDFTDTPDAMLEDLRPAHAGH